MTAAIVVSLVVILALVFYTCLCVSSRASRQEERRACDEALAREVRRLEEKERLAEVSRRYERAAQELAGFTSGHVRQRETQRREMAVFGGRDDAA
jgi:hypothetical protein